jgi:Helix-turn-helix domain
VSSAGGDASGIIGRVRVDGDPVTVSVAGFAAQLRELREQAGRPSYRQLAKLTHYSHTALSQAAAGSSLPSLAVTQAFVRACGGDVEEWSARWREVQEVVRPHPAVTGPAVTGPSVTGPAGPVSRWRAVAGRVRLKGRVALAAGIAATACIAAVLLWPAHSTTATNRPRLQMESSGLYVRYVVVTNLGPRAGYAFVVNITGGKVHRSPRPVRPDRPWKYFFDRDLRDGAQICGSIDLGPATCAAVRA